MAKGKRKVSSKGGSSQTRAPAIADLEGDSPDEDSDDYYHDEVDQFHSNKDKILLDSGAKIPSDDASSGEDEVLAFDDDDDDDSDDDQYEEMKKRLKQIRSQGHKQAMVSDLEDESDEEKDNDTAKGGKNEKAWGSARSKFYGGHDSDLDEDLSGSEPEAAALEEQEALAVQKRLLMAMDEDDIGFDMIKQAPQAQDKPTEKISKDLSKLSKKEKLKLLKKQSPELLDMIQDFKLRSKELRERLLPIVNLIRNKKLSSVTSGAKLIETKTSLCMNYLVNLSFYFMLKAKQSPIENHPVIKRLLQYRNLLKQTDQVEEKARSQLDSILERIEKGEQFETIVDEPTEPKFKSVLLEKNLRKGKKAQVGKKKLSELMASLEEDKTLLQDREDISEGQPKAKKSRLDQPDDMEDSMKDEDGDLDDAEGEDYDEEEAEEYDDEDETEDGERRGINYQIAKNKGLTVKKRKEARNPRVKHKLKYKKAKIRRKGQVREVRKEMDRYGGEMSGIRAGIKRSIKLK